MDNSYLKENKCPRQYVFCTFWLGHLEQYLQSSPAEGFCLVQPELYPVKTLIAIGKETKIQKQLSFGYLGEGGAACSFFFFSNPVRISNCFGLVFFCAVKHYQLTPLYHHPCVAGNLNKVQFSSSVVVTRILFRYDNLYKELWLLLQCCSAVHTENLSDKELN